MENWMFFLLIAIITSTLERVSHRYILREKGDARTYTMVYQFVASFALLPFIVSDIKSNTLNIDKPTIYGVLLVSSFFWVTFGLLRFHSYKHAEVSVTSLLSRTRIVWSLVIGVIIFKESVTATNLLGIALILIGTIALSAKGTLRYNPGVWYALLSAIAISIAQSIDKFLGGYFSPAFITFSAFFTASLWLFITLPKRRQKIYALLTSKGRYSILTAILGAVSYWALLSALIDGQMSTVVPIYQAALSITVLAGIIFLNERTNVKLKAFSGIIVLSGVFFIL